MITNSMVLRSLKNVRDKSDRGLGGKFYFNAEAVLTFTGPPPAPPDAREVFSLLLLSKSPRTLFLTSDPTVNTLCGLQLWSFGSLDDTWAFTTKPRSEHPYTLTALHPYLIKYLAKDDITPAESFSLQFQVTALVINDFYLLSDVR